MNAAFCVTIIYNDDDDEGFVFGLNEQSLEREKIKEEKFMKIVKLLLTF